MVFQPADGLACVVQATSTTAAATAIPASAAGTTHAMVTNASATPAEYIAVGFGVGSTAATAAGTYVAGGSSFVLAAGQTAVLPIPRGSTYFGFDSATGTPALIIAFGWAK